MKRWFPWIAVVAVLMLILWWASRGVAAARQARQRELDAIIAP